MTLPAFRLSGGKGRLAYDVSGRDAGQDDQRYRARLGLGVLEIRGRLDDIPHRLGEGRTIFGQGAPGEFGLPSALQRALQAQIDALAAGPAPLDYGSLSSSRTTCCAGGGRPARRRAA